MRHLTSDPSVWGPLFWYTLHNGAAAYPHQPTPTTQRRMIDFIAGIPAMLPCDACYAHACAYIVGYVDRYGGLGGAVKSRRALELFFEDFHDVANAHTGKPPYDRFANPGIARRGRTVV
jgi:hypothetical protein